MDQLSDRPEQAAQFLLKDYELKISYLNAHFSRMWTRFNYFLSIETALVGGKIVFSGGGDLSASLAIVGLLVAIVWYAMGAEDRYLVKLYRSQVNDVGELLGKCYFPAQGVEHYTTVGAIPRVMPTGSWRLYSWRLEAISTTRLAAWIPLLVAIGWTSVLVMLAR